ncbi:MAG: hypothetical protein K9K80_01330 [Spirochaetia bacterium]|nr:hypothetical protein [Spirochaetia bacterium]
MEDFIDYVYQNRLATADYTGGDTVFINNNDLFSEYVDFYGDNFTTKSSLTRKLKEASDSFLDYEIHKTSKKINRKTYRGFEIKIVMNSDDRKSSIQKVAHTPLLTITIEVKTKINR